MKCSACGNEIAADSPFCGSCREKMGPEAMATAATVAMPVRVALSGASSTADEGRFPSGSLLDERYRILGLAGRGGMGEVYRATDLKLGQVVALKFLPEEAALDERMRARLHGEVRIARQVSHPNVCRVYDVGEIENAPYISMEYVDGEDLGSLLRRIGRLPSDKAVEISRKLCAGLAAAHDKGVLHRDLKPANVMIDGRGEVLIMDFGLAGVEGQVNGREIRNGTPAYMAPEQLAGREVTVKSDLYALGLVLYEMFTGKRAFEGARRGRPATVSMLVKDIDPAVERVIERCMTDDPRGRPASALAVAAGLPGGDPLAAALAMGETPSPEMVAAAGDSDAMPVSKLRLWLALAVVGLAAAVVMESAANPMEWMPFELSPDVLQQRARDLIRSVGYTARPVDSANGFLKVDSYSVWAQSHFKPTEVRTQLAAGQPSLFYFWYRQSPQYLEPLGPRGEIGLIDPPMNRSGMIRVLLTPDGRLHFFDAIPPQVDSSQGARQVDWSPLFASAGLDMSKFASDRPAWTPDTAFDERAAWTGVFPNSPAIPVRVEAAAWRGRPVTFRLVGPWTQPDRETQPQQTFAERGALFLSLGVPLAIVAGAILLALRNYKRDRVDIRGANRVAGVQLCAYTLTWLTNTHHVASEYEVTTLCWAVAQALGLAGVFWVLYLAVEPYVRRRWPQSLVGWSRMLTNGLRDPQVGAQVLVGIALGLTYMSTFAGRVLAARSAGAIQTSYEDTVMAGLRPASGVYLGSLGGAPVTALGILCFFFLVRVLLRREWLAAAVVVLVGGLVGYNAAYPATSIISYAALYGLGVLTLLRFGILPMAVGVYVTSLFIYVPITTNLSAWYVGPTIVSVCIVAAMIAWSFYTALAGRSMLREGFLDE